MEYEFRFFCDQTFQALHVTALETNAEACERARAYLKGSPEFSHVEVRRGFQFMRRIENDFIPGEVC